MSEFQPDLSNPSRCISVHWSLPTQCERGNRHVENWHWAKHPDSGRPIRYRYGAYVTEELNESGWHALPIPAPERRDAAFLLSEVERLRAERDELADTLDATMLRFEEYVEDNRSVEQERNALRVAGKAVIEQRDEALADRDRARDAAVALEQENAHLTGRLDKATRFEVSGLPDGHRLRHHFVIRVEHRGRGTWAVVQQGEPAPCLSSDGEWDWEMRPSERTDEWIATHRFDLDAALRLAEEHADRLTVNGRTAADVLARDGGES